MSKHDYLTGEYIPYETRDGWLVIAIHGTTHDAKHLARLGNRSEAQAQRDDRLELDTVRNVLTARGV